MQGVCVAPLWVRAIAKIFCFIFNIKLEPQATITKDGTIRYNII